MKETKNKVMQQQDQDMFSTIAALVLFLSSDSNKKVYCELKTTKIMITIITFIYCCNYFNLDSLQLIPTRTTFTMSFNFCSWPCLMHVKVI